MYVCIILNISLIQAAGLSPAVLFCFDAVATKWVIMPATAPGPPSARADPGLAAAPDGRLYLFGGSFYSDPYGFNDLWRFTPATGAWELLANGGGTLPSQRGPNCFAAAPDGSFYTYGGYRYNPVGLKPISTSVCVDIKILQYSGIE